MNFHEQGSSLCKRMTLKGYLHNKMITFQTVPSEAQVKNFFVS